MALHQQHHRIHIYLGEYRISTTFGLAGSKKFTSNECANISNTMLPLVEWQEQSIANLISNSSTYDAIHGLDSTFVPDEKTRDVMGWIRVMMELVNKFDNMFDTFNQGLLFIPQMFMTESIA